MPKEEKHPRRGPGAHKIAEKPKNFKVAIKKLILNLKAFWGLIIVAFVLAGVASILTLMAPNKLSNLTDEITKGLSVDAETLKDISEQIANRDFKEEVRVFASMLFKEDFKEENIARILTSQDFSEEDKRRFQAFLLEVEKNSYDGIDEVSSQIKNAFFKDVEYQGILISKTDKLEFLSLLEKDFLSLGKLPDSIQRSLFQDIVYDKEVISSQDQITFLIALEKLGNNEDTETILKAIDELPTSIYDIIKPKIDFDAVKSIVLVIAFLYGINALFGFVEGLIMVHVANNYSRKVRNSISKKINKLPLSYFDTNTIGDVLSRVTNDVDTVSQEMNHSFTTLVSALALFLGSLIMMFYTNYLMAITAVVSSLVGFVFMFGILGKSQKYFIARQKELGNINGHIEEIFSGHNVVKLYNGEDMANETFDALNEKVYECERKSQFLSGLMHPFMSFIGNFGYVCVCIVGALLTLKGTISFGVIVAFMLYIRLFTNPLTQLAQAMTSMQSVAAASERVFEFLEQKEMEDETHKRMYLEPNKVKGEIVFSHVSFGYTKDKMIIKDFNAHVMPGQKIAIVGPTGAGKTTLVNLLMRFYEIDDGDIQIDGVSIKDLTRDNIHKLFIMVLQDTWLFNGTIRDNIVYNKENVTDEEIKKVCDVVGVLHYIKTLPKGLDSEIKDVSSISAGQKQLLTIARGMIEDAPFLILDEATSNVDTRTEELVQKAMDKLTTGRTSFIIAHRLSTIKNADLILVMNEGNIIEMGNHEDLMQQNGFYANLYNSQFESFKEE